MSDPFIGEIRMFAGNFAPRGWALCNGQLLPISQNTALFSILGTTYGGNGQTTFGLPDLRGRVALHPGQGPGLSPYTLGEQGGSESVTLLTTNMPAHTHMVNASTTNATAPAPTNGILASPLDSNAGAGLGYVTTSPNTQMAPNSIAPSGGSQPHENRQPYNCVNYIIALQGIFPSRN